MTPGSIALRLMTPGSIDLRLPNNKVSRLGQSMSLSSLVARENAKLHDMPEKLNSISFVEEPAAAKQPTATSSKSIKESFGVTCDAAASSAATFSAINQALL